MPTIQEINKLRQATGCPMHMCYDAIEYAETHEGCTPIGYLKAMTFAVKIEPFEEKVRRFSK